MRWLFERLNVYPNAYYNYLKDRKAEARRTKTKVLRTISELYHYHDGIPGYRMMTYLLAQKGINYSNQTVFQYMHSLGLTSITRRKSKYRYIKGRTSKIFPNLLNQEFYAPEKNKIWCCDFTYLPMGDGQMRYNCSILDLYDRSIVATLNGDHIDADLAQRTLQKAIIKENPKRGLIFHTDQGSQFGAIAFMQFCALSGIQQSMSRAGCPYDNAPMERFYNTFKCEYFSQHIFYDPYLADAGVYRYILDWYNQRRPHSYNDGLPPAVARKSTRNLTLWCYKNA